MLTDLFNLHTVVVGSSQINQCQMLRFEDGVEIFRETGSGIPDPSWTAVMRVGPTAGFTTQALARALTLCGINGLNITTGTTPLDMNYQRKAQGGTRQTGNTAFKVSMAAGMLLPVSVTSRQGQAASIDYRAIPRSTNGTTASVTKTDNAALPSLTAADQAYTVGPIKLNGTLLAGNVDTRIDFNIRTNSDNQDAAADGNAYDTFLCIEDRKPMIVCRGKSIQTLTGLHTAISSSTIVYLRQMAQGSTRTADATAQHIAFTIAAGTAYTRSINGQSGSSAELELCIEPHFDGTNDIIQVSTASAIA